MLHSTVLTSKVHNRRSSSRSRTCSPTLMLPLVPLLLHIRTKHRPAAAALERLLPRHLHLLVCVVPGRPGPLRRLVLALVKVVHALDHVAYARAADGEGVGWAG